MIDPKKTYRTCDGREVRIYAVDGGGHNPIHGAVRNEWGWTAYAWPESGAAALQFDTLIEVKPRIKREVWVNVYPGPIVCEIRHTKADADDDAMLNRIACVKLTIDCEEGEGL
jgi:hypothetical protein